jgi:hypothetical protein
MVVDSAAGEFDEAPVNDRVSKTIQVGKAIQRSFFKLQLRPVTIWSSAKAEQLDISR